MRIFLRHGDDLDGALFGAGAAIGALFGIDGGEEISDGDGAGGANLGAHHAADAAGGADLAERLSLMTTQRSFLNTARALLHQTRR